MQAGNPVSDRSFGCGMQNGERISCVRAPAAFGFPFHPSSILTRLSKSSRFWNFISYFLRLNVADNNNNMLLLKIVFLVILFSQNQDEKQNQTRRRLCASSKAEGKQKKPKQNASVSKVEMKRFELSTLRMRTVRSSQLSYTPEQMIL